MALYGLMAIVPALLGVGVMMLYLHHSVRSATRQFRHETQTTLHRYQIRVESSTQRLLRGAFREVSEQTQQGLQQQQRAVAQQQGATLGRALGMLRQHTEQSMQQLQRATRQTLQGALDGTAQQIGMQQARALDRLASTATQASRDAIRAQVEQSSLSLTASLGRQVEGVLRNTLAQLTLIAQQPALQEVRLQESRWILQALIDREPAYRLLCLRDTEGTKLVTVGEFTPPEGSLQPLVAQLWQQMTESDQPVVGQVVMVDMGAGEEPMLPVLAPVRARGVELRGAIFALVSMDDLNQLMRTFRLGKQGYAMLCTVDGLILAHPDRRRVGQRDERLAPLLAEATEAMRPQLQERDGMLIVLAPIARLNACLIVAQPAAEVFHLADTLQTQFAHARTAQQGALENAIRQIRRQASNQVNQQMEGHQRSLLHALRQAEQQTLRDSKQLLEAQSRASREHLAQRLKARLGASQRELQQQLTALSRLSDLSEQFGKFTTMLQQQIADQMLGMLLIVLLGVLLLSLVGSVYLYRTLNMPLKALVDATRTIAQGDLSHRVHLSTRNAPELQQLADSFNHMVDALAKAEAQLIQTSKLASLGTLASGVAHELNQPLAIIRGIAQQTIQVLANSEWRMANGEGDDAGNENSPLAIRHSLLEDMRLIERQTQRMSQIIQHLRTFARKPREAREPVNLNEVAQNALVLLREQLRQRGIELIEEYDPDLPPVLGEANALEQVVINLLTNARDALENREHGQVIIRTRLVAPPGGRGSRRAETDGGQGSAEPPCEWVELIVRDNGAGVPPELRSQIFDPFFTTKDPNKGTGLGLAISLEIAQKHGGTLLLSDPPEGSGAIFTLRLPAAAQQQQRAA